MNNNWNKSSFFIEILILDPEKRDACSDINGNTGLNKSLNINQSDMNTIVSTWIVSDM